MWVRRVAVRPRLRDQTTATSVVKTPTPTKATPVVDLTRLDGRGAPQHCHVDGRQRQTRPLPRELDPLGCAEIVCFGRAAGSSRRAAVTAGHLVGEKVARLRARIVTTTTPAVTVCRQK
jgi:hypothetical protein